MIFHLNYEAFATIKQLQISPRFKWVRVGTGMPKADRQKAAFRACRGRPYPWKDFERMLLGMGYQEKKSGKTSGSVRKYWNPVTNHLIRLHEPHDGVMGPDMVRRLQNDLSEAGLL
jgi:hypothetical protein